LSRVLVVIIGCIIVLATSVYLQQSQPLVKQIASGMLGETWYRISLNSDHVGYMYNNTFVDHLGRWHFQTTTHFQLESNSPNTISKHLIFAAQAPFALHQATYNNRGQSQNYTTTVTAAEHGMTAHLKRGATENNVPLDWEYSLEDFLSFERWLASNTPAPETEHITANPDFERLLIITRPYRVVEKNSQGYLVETNAMLAATRTQLNHNYRPLKLNMAGIFDVVSSTEAQAISLDKLKHKTHYLFPVDQRLDNHTKVARLHLRIQGVEHMNLPQQLKLSYNPITSKGNGVEYLGEELHYPITHAKVQSLVQQSLANRSGNAAGRLATIEALVETAHQQLVYAENKPAGSVLRALEKGQGECTDFADLFTTLARAAGYPARTVYGLAYKDDTQPTFMFHAWNEVLWNGKWQAVDPTWNQTPVDATHIPLSESQAALMMLANNTGQVSFSVVDVAYFPVGE
jgi:transglutaminase superfamily protein